MIQNKSRINYVSDLHAAINQKTVVDERVSKSHSLQTKDDIEHPIEPTKKVSLS
jgi:hypothetical protein